MIIDQAVHPLIADSLPLLGAGGMPIAGDGVTGAGESGEPVRVHMQQVSGARPRVAARRFPWHAWETRQVSAPQCSPRRGMGMAGLTRDQPRPQPVRCLTWQIRSASFAGNRRGEERGRDDRSKKQVPDPRSPSLARS